MSLPRYRPARLFVTAKQKEFSPTITNIPPLPPVDFSALGQSAPTLLTGSGSGIPAADTIVITWADAEWAAMQHVFCTPSNPMPYTDRNTGEWSGWTKYSNAMPSTSTSGWSFWGEWRLVGIGTKRVLLWKSNTHLDFPGPTQLVAMMQMLLREVKPSLVLSIGTAGGAQVTDHIGTIRAVSAGTLYEAAKPQSSWPIYTNDWTPENSVATSPAGFASLLFPVPTTEPDLRTLAAQFNTYYGTNYSIFDLDPGGLNTGDTQPKIIDATGGKSSLLTTPTFVVGTTAGTYADFACIEMDDALLGEVCSKANTAFGFVRNVSDPVQNATLPAEIQGNWGSTIYDTYGIYTSFNGALTAWAMLAG